MRLHTLPYRLGMVSVIVGVLMIGWHVEQSVAASRGLKVGQQPPAFRATDLNGDMHSLEAYRERVIVLHFWATWCPFCRGEVAKLTQIHQRWDDQDVMVLTVSVDQDASALRQFVREKNLPYTVIPDYGPPGRLASRYGVRGIPMTYLIQRDGTIAARFSGQADLLGAVEELVAPSERVADRTAL